MSYIDIIGFIGGALTTLALVPQVAKAWKTKHTQDVSLWWIVILSTGIFLWLVYGILIKSTPIIAANGATLILSLAVLILKVKYK